MEIPRSPSPNLLPDLSLIESLLAALQAKPEGNLNFGPHTARAVTHLYALLMHEYSILPHGDSTAVVHREFNQSFAELSSCLKEYNLPSIALDSTGKIPAYWLETRNIWHDDIKPALLRIIREFDKESDNLNYQIGYAPDSPLVFDDTETQLVRLFRATLVATLERLQSEKRELSQSSTPGPTGVLTIVQEQFSKFIEATSSLHRQLTLITLDLKNQVEHRVSALAPERKWNWFDFTLNFAQTNLIPSQPGTYLFVSNRVLYVGASTNLAQRLKSHSFLQAALDGKLEAPLFIAISCADKDQAFLLETRLINLFQPPLNKRGIKDYKADSAAAKVFVNMPKAVALFGKTPTVAQLYEKDHKYFNWIAESIEPDNEKYGLVADACRVYLKEVEEDVRLI